MPDFSVRLTDPVIEQLERIRQPGWWHDTMARWLRRSGSYEGMIRRVLREEGLPQDLIAVVMIESSFDPLARSYAGATGLWQFMPAAGAERGLTRDHWVDQRYDPERSTRAAAQVLRRLHERLGSWELALAAYNMGYYGLVATVRTFNTNDYWRLRDYEYALPHQTRNYVPRIFAAAVVLRNPERFGFEEIERVPALEYEVLEVPQPTGLGHLARLVGSSVTLLKQLNPELRRGCTPAGSRPYRLRVPLGTRDKAAPHLRALAGASKIDQHEVMVGEDLESIAHDHGISQNKLARLNELSPRAAIEPGTILEVPAKVAPADPEKAVKAVVPDRRFVYRDRSRVFYRVVVGDTLERVAQAFAVTPGELVLWNDLDPEAELQTQMILQVFVPARFPGKGVRFIEEARVRHYVAGSIELYEEVARGREQVRLVYQTKRGDTLQRISRRFKISLGMLARINHISRNADLEQGEELILYIDPGLARSRSPGKSPSRRPE
jgi:membrane-bound lytic murein transglycosylase D